MTPFISITTVPPVSTILAPLDLQFADGRAYWIPAEPVKLSPYVKP